MKCFVTFRLKQGVSFEEYERWFHEENLPAVAKQTATRNLRVWRAVKVHEGEPAWEVIEELDVDDLEQTEREFRELPEMQRMLEQWRGMVEGATVAFAEELEQPNGGSR